MRNGVSRKEADLRRINIGKKTTLNVCNWRVFGAIAAVGYATQSVAALGDAVTEDEDYTRPYVGGLETYDSNLYRLPTYITDVATLISPNARRDDYISSVFAGIDGQWFLAQQQVGLNLSVSDNRFAYNKQLDNYSEKADLLWKWHLGSQFSGDAGGDFARSLASYAETLYLGRDVLNLSDYFADARYQIGPRWAVYGGIREAETTQSAVEEKFNDSRASTGKVGVELTTAVDNTVGFEYAYAYGHFPNGAFYFQGEPFDRDFNQSTANFLLKYALSDKTVINASAGYQKRDYIHEPIGGFSGAIWGVSLQWQPTDKTQIVFSGSRQLQVFLSSQSDYYVSTGGSISPVWAASEKLIFKLTVSSFDDKFISSTLTVLTFGSRHDTVTTGLATINYFPMHNLVVNFSYTYLDRESNVALYKFDDKLASASVKFTF